MTRRAFLAGLLAWAMASSAAPAAGFREVATNIFAWSDTCNVYILRDGESAILIDLGDGSVLDRLGEIGVKHVEWVLFTHHHREQCRGAPKLRGTGVRLAAPAAERALFEQPASFRKMQVRLNDQYTVHGASYVRPPVVPIKLDRAFRSMDVFEWRGLEIWCIDTRGNSPGAMSYLLRQGDRWLAFTGDLMLDGARMHTWFDSEWDYGFASGIHALANSAALVAGFEPQWLFPSHGPLIRDPAEQLEEYQRKLVALERLLIRGYPVNSFTGVVQDKVSRPSEVPHVWRVSPHIYKFRGPNQFPNFYLILSDNGRALVVDCGLLDTNMLDQAIDGMKRRLGLKIIDAAVITHMHGDHFLQAPHLREKYGAKIWALDRMADVCEHPEWFDYAAPIQAYGSGIDGLKFDRLFKDGESFEWEGYKFTIDWMPGQTEFALCMHGMIDGKKVAFTGDNLFGDPDDPEQTGHEAVVARNSAILEEGYIYAAEYLAELQPDILLGGHSYVMDRPGEFIERYRRWAHDMREGFRALSCFDDYYHWFDPFWVRVEPYRVVLKGDSVEVKLNLRNIRDRAQRMRVAIHPPPGVAAEPPVVEADLAAGARQAFPIRLKAAGAPPGVHIIGLDVTLGSERLGEWFDCVVEITK